MESPLEALYELSYFI